MKKFLVHLCTIFIWSKSKRKIFRDKFLNNKNNVSNNTLPQHHFDEEGNLVIDSFWFAKNYRSIQFSNNVYFLCRNIVHINTIIGRYSYIGEYTRIDENVRIGRYCSIATNVVIGATKHPINWLSTSPFQYDKWLDPYTPKQTWNKSDKTCIGNDVWIGANAVILSGVTIGDGAIIGSSAVVTRDVPPYAIVAGVPAKVIKYRFPEDTIEKLLQVKWWNFKHEQIRQLNFSNVQQILKGLE